MLAPPPEHLSSGPLRPQAGPGRLAEARPQPLEPDENGRPSRDSYSAMRLLIIEDERDAADYLVKAFREVGHVADNATDGEEGLALALDGQYEVLIVDRMLPKLDGLAVIGTLRSRSVDTPVLILSALGQVD